MLRSTLYIYDISDISKILTVANDINVVFYNDNNATLNVDNDLRNYGYQSGSYYIEYTFRNELSNITIYESLTDNNDELSAYIDNVDTLKNKYEIYLTDYETNSDVRINNIVFDNDKSRYIIKLETPELAALSIDEIKLKYNYITTRYYETIKYVITLYPNNKALWIRILPETNFNIRYRTKPKTEIGYLNNTNIIPTGSLVDININYRQILDFYRNRHIDYSNLRNVIHYNNVFVDIVLFLRKYDLLYKIQEAFKQSQQSNNLTEQKKYSEMYNSIINSFDEFENYLFGINKINVNDFTYSND